MASSSTQKPNPVSPAIETLILEARAPETSFERLVELFKHPEVEVRRALLDNPNLCPTDADGKLNTRLLKDLAREFPEEVANHPVFVLHALIEPNNEIGEVMIEVVVRTEDVGLIDRIFRTWGPSWGGVRSAVAWNPNTPVDLLRTLGSKATESNEWVRRAVTKNPNTPVDLLRTMTNPATEFDKDVRKAAQKALAERGLA